MWDKHPFIDPKLDVCLSVSSPSTRKIWTRRAEICLPNPGKTICCGECSLILSQSTRYSSCRFCSELTKACIHACAAIINCHACVHSMQDIAGAWVRFFNTSTVRGLLADRISRPFSFVCVCVCVCVHFSFFFLFLIVSLYLCCIFPCFQNKKASGTDVVTYASLYQLTVVTFNNATSLITRTMIAFFIGTTPLLKQLPSHGITN